MRNKVIQKDTDNFPVIGGAIIFTVAASGLGLIISSIIRCL